jgi:dipeptidyl aminopeptidase/acylaminoacyl peptidase
MIFGAGHGFYQPQHVELYHNYVMDFLKRHLK